MDLWYIGYHKIKFEPYLSTNYPQIELKTNNKGTSVSINTKTRAHNFINSGRLISINFDCKYLISTFPPTYLKY